MISPSKRGTCVEYEAILLFTRAGFEVFSNAHPDGPVDLVVWDGKNTYLIDTKKIQPYVNKHGIKTYNWDKKNASPDIHYLGNSGSEWIWLSEAPEALSSVI